MNLLMYNYLLKCTQKLIYKYPFLPLNKYDYVHECWDFETDNFKAVINKIYGFFYSELKAHCVSFPTFSCNIDELDLDANTRKFRRGVEEGFKQCNKCENVLIINSFQRIKKDDCYARTCYKCNYKFSREKLLAKSKKYNYTERGKALHRLSCLKWRTENPEENRKRHQVYYQANKEKICEKKREGRKLGLIKDRTAHERYLRYKEKMFLKKGLPDG